MKQYNNNYTITVQCALLSYTLLETMFPQSEARGDGAASPVTLNQGRITVSYYARNIGMAWKQDVYILLLLLFSSHLQGVMSNTVTICGSNFVQVTIAIMYCEQHPLFCGFE